MPDVLTTLSLEVEEEVREGPKEPNRPTSPNTNFPSPPPPQVLKEYGTLSGFLVFSAGEIPKPGDIILIDKWQFEIMDADERRILQVSVEKLVGAAEFDSDSEGNGKNGKGRVAAKVEDEDEEVDEEFPNSDDIVDEQGKILSEKIENIAESSVEKRAWSREQRNMEGSEGYLSDLSGSTQQNGGE